ncbi:ATP-binding cassette domain-containing protein [Pseudodesulfovibrio senegalensis]|jgi:molybdate transport system ATP-binding protein|uniref:ATP-binding cassette domain-containing protein n=1 Tax=Pseudodesulfovibrio senegalensis TaxID=1721087 RepID=A0A6N6N1S8_9BACT|nr:ATP-binding cassette domain-containing protein [Pseudodesulfovibrio senegalensis]KAB1441348.1 ATP-binding cassette domain-containing protein [Pseudodesulfovibrio senegalensis]
MTAPSILQVAVRKQLDHYDLDVDFTCEAGTLTAIVGPSGAGKTTLIRIIAGLERPDAGRVCLGDTCWTDTDAGVFMHARKRRLGLVFQEYTLFPHLNVRKNVAFAASDPGRVEQLMTLFGISHLADKRPSAISGGERQRAAFCQALARDPVLLLLDEPFSALDAGTRRSLRSELRDIKDELDIPVLHVTHDLEEAEYLGDSILAVDHGRVSPDWFSGQMCSLRSMNTSINQESYI